jgi:hypothetical protein
MGWLRLRQQLGGDWHEVSRSCTSPQLNTHIPDGQDVWYPWHPYYGQAVIIYEVLERLGHTIVRCRLAHDDSRRLWEVSHWMLDRAVCRTMHLAQAPVVSTKALWTLKLLLHHQHADSALPLLQGQHHGSLEQGDADAQSTQPTSQHTAGLISASFPARMANLTLRGPADSDNASCHAAPPTPSETQGRRQGGGQ